MKNLVGIGLLALIIVAAGCTNKSKVLSGGF